MEVAMSLELMNTLGTLTTAVIIAATAIAAMVQLRHMRAGNQINAMLAIGNQFDAREFRDALAIVDRKLDSAMDDPALREYYLGLIRGHQVQDVTQEYQDTIGALRFVANTYEELGILVKNDIIDENLFLDRYSFVIARTWDRMQRTIAWGREATQNDAIWENFEYLTVLSKEYMRQHPSSYPKGVPRLQVVNPWPVSSVAQTG